VSYTETPRYRRCQALFDRAYPNFRNAGQVYADWVAEAIPADGVVLDVGCGRMSLAADALRRARRTVGIDLVAGDLRHNQTIHLPLLADATALPFPARAFDTVISQWVIEHFDCPADALREMARVLRPGGRVIALTTNANNYVPLMGRLVPDSARNLAIRRLLRRPAHESHKTYYRANTARQLERLAAGVGLRVRRTAYVGNPFYFAFNVPLFRLALLFEHLTDSRPLRGLKLYLLADLERLP